MALVSKGSSSLDASQATWLPTHGQSSRPTVRPLDLCLRVPARSLIALIGTRFVLPSIHAHRSKVLRLEGLEAP